MRQYQKRVWSQAEDDFLRANYRTLSDAKIAKALGCSPWQAFSRRHELGLEKDAPREWSQAEDDFLLQNFCALDCAELGKELGRTKSSVSNRLRILGLKRPPEIAAAMHRKTCFEKGMTPWNKGKKGLRLSPQTEFKTGQKPHNTLYDGAIRTRRHKRTSKRYMWIRLAEAHWIMLHVFIWEKSHGPVPKGRIIVFRNKNTMDVRLENLECITRRELARRNKNVAKATRSLRRYRKNGISDKHVAGYLAPGDPALRDHIVANRPDLIALKRSQMKLNATIKKERQP